MRCIGQNTHIQLIPEKFHATAFTVRNLSPSYPALIPAFLRHKIFCQILLNRFFINSQSGTFLPVGICLFRPEAIPLHAVKISIQFKEDTEFRHICQARYCFIGKCGFNRPVSEHFIGKHTAAFGNRRHIIPVRNRNTVFFLLHIRIDERLLASVYRLIHACDFPLCIAVLHLIPAIIVNRSTPEVWHGHCFNQFSPAVYIRSQTGTQCRKQGRKILAAHTEIPVSAYNRQILFTVVWNKGALINLLAEGNFVPGFCPECVFLHCKGNRYGKLRQRLPKRCGSLFQSLHPFEERIRKRETLF